MLCPGTPATRDPSRTADHTFELFAEIGVILLMFFIGAEFSPQELLRLKWVGLLGGSLGLLSLMGLGFGAARLLGWPPVPSLVVGMIVSTASTLVLVRHLLDRGELHARHGRVAVGITLVDDLAVVIFIFLMPSLGALEPGRFAAVGLALGKALAVLLPFGFLAAKGLPRLLSRIARTQNRELFLLFTLILSVGTAALSQAVGLSLALGAFLAGLLISGSDYAHEALARLLPLRDLFVAIFFVTVGVLIDPRTLLDNVPLTGAMVGLVVGGKLLVWILVVRLFGDGWRTAVLVAVSLTQIGEFAFLLARAGMSAGHVGQEVFNATLVTSLLTILVNAFLVRRVPAWLGGRDRGAPEDARIPGPLERFRQAMGLPLRPCPLGPDILPELREVLIGSGDLADQSLREARVRERFGILVLAIERANGEIHLNPSADTILRPGDRVRVFGLPEQVRTFEAAGRDGGTVTPGDETQEAQAGVALDPERTD